MVRFPAQDGNLYESFSTIYCNIFSVYKHSIRGYPQCSVEYLYQQVLSPAGFQKVIVEFFRRKPMSFKEINNILQVL